MEKKHVPKYKFIDISKYYYQSSPKFNFKADSTVWISCGDFVGYFCNGELTRLQIENENIPKKFIFDDNVINKNNIYIAWNRNPFGVSFKRIEGLLVSYNIESQELFYFIDEYKILDSKKTYIRDMCIDSRGHLWIITGLPMSTQIIKIVSRENIEVFDSQDKGLYKYYTFIYEDSQERIWIGSISRGIFMYEYDD